MQSNESIRWFDQADSNPMRVPHRSAREENIMRMLLPAALTLFAFSALALPVHIEIPPGGYAWMTAGSTEGFTVQGEPLISPGPWRGDRNVLFTLIGPQCLDAISGLPDEFREGLLLRLTDLLALPIDVGSDASPAFADINCDGHDDLVVFDGDGGVQAYGYPQWEEIRRFAPPSRTHGGFDLDGDGTIEHVQIVGDGSIALGSSPLSMDTLTGFSFGEPSGAALGDVGGDGLADIILGLRDGRVVVCRNRGTASSPVFLPWSSETREMFPMSPGAFAAPAFVSGSEPLLLVGTSHAGLKAYRPLYAEGDPWPLSWQEARLAPFEGESSNLTPAVVDDRILICERRGGVSAMDPGTGESVAAGIPPVPGTYPVITAGEVPYIEGLVLLAGTREGRFYLLRPEAEGREYGWELIDGLPEISSGAPAFCDDGLAVGTSDGEIRLFIPDTLGAWTEAIEDSPFRGLDVGEYSIPSFADINGDGQSDLLIGNARGELICLSPTSSIREGVELFEEIYAWEFRPNSAVSDLDRYYSRYYRECPDLMSPADTDAVLAFAAELVSAEPRFRDEIAFCISNTPTEVLREMYQNGDADLFTANARSVYEMADRLPYAKLTDINGATELSLTVDSGPVTVSSEAYYRFVVHPRILFEIPARVNASFWLQSADSLGMTEEEWLRYDQWDLYADSTPGEALFWRTVLPDDTLFGRSLMEGISDAPTMHDALLRFSNYLSYAQPAGIINFGYLSNDLQPMVIDRKAYGSCGEQSIIQTALCRALLIPAYVVGCRGEDHQWNEYLDPATGRWTHWDVNYGTPTIAHIWHSGEGIDHHGKTISSITAFGPDDVTWQTTGSALAIPGSGYMPGDSGYTLTASVEILVTDSEGTPVEGAMVLVRSHWDRRNMVCVFSSTDLSGYCSFDLGWEPYGGYTIDVISPFGAGGSSSISFEEGENYSLEYRLPGTAPWSQQVLTPDATPSQFSEPCGILPVADEARSYPVSYYTGQLYSLGESEEGSGYRGARWFPKEPEPLSDGLLYMDSKNFAAYSAGEDCRALRRPFEPLPGDTCYAVLDNRGSMFAWRSVTLDMTSPAAPSPLDQEETRWLSMPIEDPVQFPVSTLSYPCDSLLSEQGETWVWSIDGIELHQDDPDDPLSSGWVLGPFMVPPEERSIIVASEGRTQGLDMDMYLFMDGDGNRLVDGMHELTSSSTSPTSNEEIYIPDPEPGAVYWLYMLGWSVPEDGGTLDLGMGFEPEILLVDSISPFGTVQASPARFSFRLTASADLPVYPMALFGDIEVVPRMEGDDGWTFSRPSGAALDAPLELLLRDSIGNVLETVDWEILSDQAPPSVLSTVLSVDSALMLLEVELTAFDALGGIDSAELVVLGEDSVALHPGEDSLWSGSFELLPLAGSVIDAMCILTDDAGNTSYTDTISISVPERPAVMFGFIHPSGVTYDHVPLIQVAPDFSEDPGGWTASACIVTTRGEFIGLDVKCIDPESVQFRSASPLPDGTYIVTVDIEDVSGRYLGTHSWEFTISTMDWME